MAKKNNTDFFSSLRSQGLRKSVAKALADLETRGPEARAAAEKVARSVANDLRNAAETIEKRLDVDRADAGSSAAKKAASTAKKAASTQKRGAKTRRPTPKKGQSTRADSTTKKAAPTQKRGATTRSPTPKKGATTRASSTTKKTS